MDYTLTLRRREIVRRHRSLTWRIAATLSAAALVVLAGAASGAVDAADDVILDSGSPAGERSTAKSVAVGAPIVFVPNLGQAPADVLYEARSLGRVVQLTHRGIRTRGAELDIGSYLSSRGRPDETAASGGAGLSAPSVSALGRRDGVVNLLLGDSPDGWHTNVPTYGSVRYRYEGQGVEVVFTGGAQGLQATVSANASTDLSRLPWRLTGDDGAVLATAVTGVAGDETVVLSPASRDLSAFSDGMLAGPADQLAGPADQVVTVLLDVLFASYLGGSRDDSAADVALDAQGNPIVVGTTQSSNFPTRDPYQEDIASGSFADGFVTKLNAAGTDVIWSTYLGGNREDHATDVAVDAGGNVVIVGYTGSQNFPTQDPIQEDLGGGSFDAFVAVLSGDGSQLEYGSYLGGRDSDFAYALAIGPPGPGPAGESIHVAGGTDSSDFPTENAFQSRYGSDSDAFLTVLLPDRSGYVYSTYLGANSPETAYGVDVDSGGSAHVTGYVNGPGFPLENPFQRNYRGDSDVFVTKFAPGGATLVYSSYLGGRDRDTGYALKLDPAGRAVVVGQTASRDFPPVEAYQQSLKGDSDVFISRVSVDGATLEYSTYFGGTSSDTAHDLFVDGQGQMHLTGSSFSINFPVQDPVQDRIRGVNDAIVSKFSADGQQLLFSTLYGGAREDQGEGLAVGADGSVVFVGYTSSADFPTDDASFQPDFAGQGDAFVVRLQAGGESPTPVPTTAEPSPSSTPSATPTATTPGPPATDTPTPTLETRTPSPTATGEPPTPTASPTGNVEVRIFAPVAMK